MTLKVVANLQAKSDKAAEARQAMEGLLEPTRAEPGCLHFEMWQSREDPTQFTFVEEWQDEAALEAHFDTPHIGAMLAVFDELMAAPLDLRKYDKVG